MSRVRLGVSKSTAASAVAMQHGISLPLTSGAGPSTDSNTQGDLTSRRSKRFKSKVLPYWDFERIACISTSDGNQTVIARDVPGEGTIIVQELQPAGTVESSVKAEPSLTAQENLAKTKSSKRRKVSQDENIKSTHPAVLPSKRVILSSTASNSTPKKIRLSSSPKKRKLFSLDSDFLEGQANVVKECHTPLKELASPSTVSPNLDKKTGRGSRRTNEEKENSIHAYLKISKSKKSSRLSKNIKKSSSFSKARLPSLDDPGYSTGNDSFNATMLGSELRFVMVAGSKDNEAASTGQYHITRGVVKNGISVYFIHLSKGYLAFRTPLETVFIGMVGEGYLKLMNENKPSIQIQMRPDTEIRADKDAVVAVGCQEGCSSLTVSMVTMDD